VARLDWPFGYFLRREGVDFTILEAEGEPAAAWRARWDSLKLFTPVRYSGLPGLPFPGEPHSYPTRDDVVAYLTDYVRHFELPVEFDSRVRSVRVTDGSYLVELDDRTYEADQVVVATGPFQVPFVPSIAERLDPEVVQSHSTEYRRPQDIPGGPVLVVGGGNTGFQIAEELSASGLIRKTTASRIGRRLEGRDTLIGSRPRMLHSRHGVRLYGRAVDAAGRTVSFSDGETLDAGAVIWATGFRVDHSWIHVPVFDASGRVVHRRGVTESPGLYFLGLSWLHTRGSALIGWVKDDAQYLARQIATSQRSARARSRAPEHVT
jgi:putative flavoprotein involved in K+ transport